MTSIVNIAIHASQFPDQVRRDLLHSLRTRSINHKFHYDSVKQAQKWLALHRACSPSQTDPDCAAIFERSFQATAVVCADAARLHVIGLGCGRGQKEARLLQLLRRPDRALTYTPCDVSTALVLMAVHEVSPMLSSKDCLPLVCDLATAHDLTDALKQFAPTDSPRLITCFGLIPNFEPPTIFPLLSGLLRQGDHLLLSGNLAPGSDYSAGVENILPLYDNPMTEDWLLSFLLDLGVERTDGQLSFVIEDCPSNSGLKRVAAYFKFTQARQIEIAAERFEFPTGESLRLFFSYRHTPDRLLALLRSHGVSVINQWISRSEEEGVFLCRRS